MVGVVWVGGFLGWGGGLTRKERYGDSGPSAALRAGMTAFDQLAALWSLVYGSALCVEGWRGVGDQIFQRGPRVKRKL